MVDDKHLPELQAFLRTAAEQWINELGDGAGHIRSGDMAADFADRIVDVTKGSGRFTAPRIEVDGLELTQSTQYRGSKIGVDNSVPIVALKPLVIRAYAHAEPALLGGATIAGGRIDGELVLTRQGKEVFRTGPTRSDGARIGSISQIDRTLWDKEFTATVITPYGFHRYEGNPPLNFYIPAWYLRAGPAIATVTLWSTTESWIHVTYWQSFQVLNVGAPRVAMVRVKWKDAAGTVFQATDAEMLGVTNLATRMLPFPYFETSITGIDITKTGDFSAAPSPDDVPPPKPGDCSKAWVDLLQDLTFALFLAKFFGLTDIVYGIVPNQAELTKSGPMNTGCALFGVAGSLLRTDPYLTELAFAHELGHYFGCAHVHVGGPNDEPNYPNYGGSPTTIGEVGVDTGPLVPMDPADRHDLMSYDGPQWISPFTYEKILGAKDTHKSVPADPAKVRPWLLGAFRLERLADGGRAAAIMASHLVKAPGQIGAVGAAEQSLLSIDLLDGRGRIIATHHCYARKASATGCCGCGGRTDPDREPYIDFIEAIAWSPDVAALSFHRGGKPLGRIEVGEAPSLKVAAPRLDGDRLTLRIKAKHPRATPAVLVLHSADDGLTWQPVAIDLAVDEAMQIDTANLSGGERCRLRVVATAELQASEVVTEPFALRPKPRRLFVRAAADPCDPACVRLEATVDAAGLGGVDPARLIWHSEDGGEIGRGFIATVRLEAGRRTITASMPDGLGGVASNSVTLGADRG